MTNKRKAASPIKAGTLGETASQYKIQIDATTQFVTLPDYKMANRFFDILTGGKDEAVTFQFFTDNKAVIPEGEKDPLASHPHKSRPINFNFADKKQSKGAGIFVMVNAGDGKGRSAKNVVKVRALFIDLDGSPFEPAAAALKPHIRVESSPGHWHLYWLVDHCPLEQFTPLQQAIAAKFNGDTACCDLSRVLRVPGSYHLKYQPVMTKLVEVNEFPSYTTQEIIDGLGLEMAAPGKVTRKQKADLSPSSSPAYVYVDQTTGEEIDLKMWAAQNPDFDILGALNPEYDMGRASGGKQHIVCPFADEHTDISPDLATFVANADKEHSSFAIHCMHAHCADRDRLEFLQIMLEKGWLQADTVRPTSLELKKPQWVNFPINDILSSHEWSTLKPREMQIALDLQRLAWMGNDGAFDDNDWIITRHLGITNDEWIKYREALEMSGWLIEYNGRLTNSLTKREFDKAQIAYSESCERRRNGGLARQKKLREKKAA